MKSAAEYESGVKAALERYGLSGLHRGMPFGPEHLGAERFARQLQNETDRTPARASRPATRASRLARPTQWSDRTPMDAGSLSTQAYAGAGRYQGV